MEYDLIPFSEGKSPLAQLGQEKNDLVSERSFEDYQKRIDPNTLARQKYDLSLFCLYIAGHNIIISPEDLLHKPEAWSDITHGIVSDFVQWMLEDGFAIGTINIRLSTVKTYLRLAAKAGSIPYSELVALQLVKGYSYAQGENVNEQRNNTNKGVKKSQPVALAREQVALLKKPMGTPQGRRDTLLMCLLLDHGLRCGEVADLAPDDIRLSEGLMVFRREKVKKTQRHKLSADTLVALIGYLEVYQPTQRLLAGSRKGGQLEGVMSRRAITKRVKVLGQRVLGIEGLSAHDCRHAWVESAIRGGTDIKSLQQAGGWSSPAMPLRYAGDAEIANEEVKLG